MFTYDHFTLRLFGVPLFSIVVGLTFVAAIAAFFFGVSSWQRPIGKVSAVAGGFFLLLFVLVIICVLITVQSGSMG